MPVSSADAVAKRMQRVAEAARAAQKVAVQRAALAMKETHTSGMLHDAPGGRLRNVGPKGAKISVGYKIKGGTSDPSAIVEARGPWQILNNPAKAHVIKPKTATVLHFGNVFRRSVQHPGHRGKFTWQKAEPAAAKVGAAALNKTMSMAVREAFKG